MARLIRTEKEVEGRYEEVWIVVDEDALDRWPAGPLTTVGQRVPRVDGLARARGQALFTADLQLPGMLHTAVLRSPYARARVISIDPGRMSGTPCFVGTRVPIKHLWEYLEGGDSLEEFLDAFEGVSREQAVTVLQMAMARLLEGLPTR